MIYPDREHRPWRWRVADRWLPIPRSLDRHPSLRYVVQRYVEPLILAVFIEVIALLMHVQVALIGLTFLTAWYTIVVAIIGDFWQALSPVRPTYPKPPLTLAFDAVVFVAYLTVLTALVMTVFNVQIEDPVSAAQRFSTMQTACLWNLLDTVPAIEATKTLNWDLAHPVTGHGGGACLLAYRAIVVVPALGLIAAVFKHRDENAADSRSPDEPQRAAEGTAPPAP